MKNLTWTFIGLSYGTTEQFLIDNLDVWKTKWIDTGDVVEVKDPAYFQTFHFPVYEIHENNKTVRFVAGEFSNGVWGFYVLEKMGLFKRSSPAGYLDLIQLMWVGLITGVVLVFLAIRQFTKSGVDWHDSNGWGLTMGAVLCLGIFIGVKSELDKIKRRNQWRSMKINKG
jgi:hypothetical protein